MFSRETYVCQETILKVDQGIFLPSSVVMQRFELCFVSSGGSGEVKNGLVRAGLAIYINFSLTT